MNIFYEEYDGGDFDEYLKKSVKDYHNERKNFKNNNLKYLIKYKREFLGSENYINAFYNAINNVMQLGLKPSDITFSYETNFIKKTLSDVELKNLRQLDAVAKKLGVTVGLHDYKDVFEYNEVAKADRIIKQIANEINKYNYSPLEKLLHAYLIVSNLKYNHEDVEKDISSISRSVYGVLNSDKIVCYGFSEYLRAIVSELKDENLKVFANAVGLKEVENGKVKPSFHGNNISYLKDNKYKIDGFYYLEPTWDATFENSLRYFLTEISQIKNITTCDWKVIDQDDALNLYINRYNKQHKNDKNYPTAKLKIDTYNSQWNSPEYSSISSNKGNIIREFYASYESELSGDLLSNFLASRQDFKDFVILKDTMHEMKNSKLGFDKLLEKNAKLVEEDITQSKTVYDSREVFNYLKQHSPHITIDPIQTALNKVLSNMNPDKTKDEISKMTYEILKKNIKKARNVFDDNKTIMTECEELQ